MDPRGIQAGPLVLVIDDDDDLRKVLATVLGWFGCRTWSSADGGEVLDAPRLAQVRFALVDCHLATQDGRSLADRLAARGVSVMLMSGDCRVAHQAATRHPLLAKPFDMDAVRGLLERRDLYPPRETFV